MKDLILNEIKNYRLVTVVYVYTDTMQAYPITFNLHKDITMEMVEVQWKLFLETDYDHVEQFLGFMRKRFGERKILGDLTKDYISV